MAWWSAIRGTVDRLVSRATDAARPTVAATPSPAAATSAQTVQAWGALPPVQRVLAELLEPVAPLAAFTSSLSAFQDPRFLSPLSHDVDPRVGGVVDGLANLAPTGAGSYASTTALAVPASPVRRSARVVQRIEAGWPSAAAVTLQHQATLDVDGATDPTAPVTSADSADPELADPEPADPEPGKPEGALARAAEVGVTAPASAARASLVPPPATCEPDTVPQSGAAAPLTVQRSEASQRVATVQPGEASQRSVAGVQRTLSIPAAPEPPARRGEPAPEAPAVQLEELGRPTTSTDALPQRGALPGAAPPEPLTLPSAVSLQTPGDDHAHDHRVQRTLAVVPEPSPRTARFPDPQPRELPVSRVASAVPAPLTEGSADPDMVLPPASTPAAPAAEVRQDPSGEGPAADGQADETPDRPLEPSASLLGTTPLLTPLTSSGGPAADLPPTGQSLSLQRVEAPASLVHPDVHETPAHLETVAQVEPAEPASAPLLPSLGASTEPPVPELSALPMLPALSVLPGQPVDAASPAPQQPSPTPPRESSRTKPLQRSTSTPAAPRVPLLGHREPLVPLPAPDAAGSETTPSVQPLTFLPPPQVAAEWRPDPVQATALLPTSPATAATTDTATSQPSAARTPAPAPVQRQGLTSSFSPPPRTAPLPPPSDEPTPTVLAHSVIAPTVQLTAVEPSVSEPSTPPSTADKTEEAWHLAEPAVGTAMPVTVTGEPRHEPTYEVVAAESFSEPTDPRAPSGAPVTLPQPGSVQRLAVDTHPSHPASRSAGIFSVLPARAEPRPMPPTLIVQRHRPSATTPHQPSLAAPTAGVPFASMFGGADPDPGEAGFTSVQLDSADGSSPWPTPPLDLGETVPSVARASVTTEGPAPATASGPAASGPAGADLDEMARRLFEPLSARLRAELWLDRERAGLISDARP